MTWISKKSLLSKIFKLIPILRLQVMHDYVHWNWFIDYCVELSLWDLMQLLSFHKEMISARFLWRNMLLRGELQIDAINLNFESFMSALYMKLANMPLSINFGRGCLRGELASDWRLNQKGGDELTSLL